MTPAVLYSSSKAADFPFHTAADTVYAFLFANSKMNRETNIGVFTVSQFNKIPFSSGRICNPWNFQPAVLLPAIFNFLPMMWCAP